MTEITISVRSLVEFLLRSGDLDNRTGGGSEEVMAAGARLHRKLQESAEGEYYPEVVLEQLWEYPANDENGQVVLRINGRADGIYKESGDLWGIDEIKTTYRPLRRIKAPNPVHLAQAKCYAYMYAAQNHLDKICVRMTYCNLLTEGIRHFYETYSMEELTAWYLDLMERYRPWAVFVSAWSVKRTDSIHALSFPYPYREGQRELAAGVYRTIVHEKKLFLEAPTGTGKTITTLFPSIKAVGEHKANRIFYLTAKTVTGAAAENAIRLMRQGGLSCKSVLLTAKEKVCILDHPDCNPDSCPRAKGHYDRINDAMYDLLTHEDTFSRENVALYAAKHTVCPFELSLDMSLFADVIIGDYNYLFDPHAYLRRFFAEGGAGRGEYIFLVDEAHNLVDRGREMYSAELTRESVMQLRKKVRKVWPSLYRKLGKLAKELKRIGEETQNVLAGNEAFRVADFKSADSGKGALTKAKGNAYRVLTDLAHLGSLAADVDNEIAGILSEERIAEQAGLSGKKTKAAISGTPQKMLTASTFAGTALAEGPEETEDTGDVSDTEDLEDTKKAPDLRESNPLNQREPDRKALRQELLDFYFMIDHFQMIYAELDDHYVCCARTEGRDVSVRLMCMDPSRKLKECMDRGIASVLLSATMLPITYYKALLGGTPEDYEIYAHSVFDPGKRGLYVVRDLTSRYQQRTMLNYGRIADCIAKVVSMRHGNYMVFFPSYSFLHQVEDQLKDRWNGVLRGETQTWLAGLHCMVMRQHSGMTEPEREHFLEQFRQVREDESLLGMCVMGGIFSEGIDLTGDALIGVMVVGTGIPQVCMERELLKDYFDRQGVNGYDYAYRFPGMNKVQQAAGRVIRTNEDVGIVVLMDDRFLLPESRRLFPMEWSNLQVTDSKEIAHKVERFWDEWL